MKRSKAYPSDMATHVTAFWCPWNEMSVVQEASKFHVWEENTHMQESSVVTSSEI